MLNLEPHELRMLAVTVRDYQLALLKLANKERRPNAADTIRSDAAILNAIGDKVDAELNAWTD